MIETRLWATGELDSGFGTWAYVLAAFDADGKRGEVRNSGWVASEDLRQMHMLSVVEGLRCLKRSSVLTVATTDTYLVHVFTHGLLNTWHDEGSLDSQQHTELWMELWRQTHEHRIEWRWEQQRPYGMVHELGLMCREARVGGALRRG